MALSSKIKGLKFMKRKEDAAVRREAETAAQSTLGAQGHWRLPDAGAAAAGTLAVRVEYVQAEAAGGRRVYAQKANDAKAGDARADDAKAMKRTHSDI